MQVLTHITSCPKAIGSKGEMICLQPTQILFNTQTGTIMTTIIQVRIILSDRITKWIHRYFQNRYDCSGSQC